MTTKVPLSQLTDRSDILTSGREKTLTFNGPISWQSITWKQLIRTSCPPPTQPNPPPDMTEFIVSSQAQAVSLRSNRELAPHLPPLLSPLSLSLVHSHPHPYPHHHFHYYSVCIQHRTSFHLIKHNWFGWRLVGKTGPITNRARLSVMTLVF